MDMRVKVESARVRVQHRDSPRCALQLPVALTEAQHGFPGRAHQQGKRDVGVRGDESAEFGRQGKGQQEIFGRNEPLRLPFQPLLALMVLAVRAKSMAAGMRNQTVVRAVGALKLHHRAGRTAALLDRCQRPELLEVQSVAILLQEIRLNIGDDRSEADHRGASLDSE
jgi:hypothetical protein